MDEEFELFDEVSNPRRLIFALDSEQKLEKKEKLLVEWVLYVISRLESSNHPVQEVDADRIYCQLCKQPITDEKDLDEESEVIRHKDCFTTYKKRRGK